MINPGMRRWIATQRLRSDAVPFSVRSGQFEIMPVASQDDRAVLVTHDVPESRRRQRFRRLQGPGQAEEGEARCRTKKSSTEDIGCSFIRLTRAGAFLSTRPERSVGTVPSLTSQITAAEPRSSHRHSKSWTTNSALHSDRPIGGSWPEKTRREAVLAQIVDPHLLGSRPDPGTRGRRSRDALSEPDLRAALNVDVHAIGTRERDIAAAEQALD